jgi:uncharacterized protein (TIGR03435 family)
MIRRFLLAATVALSVAVGAQGPAALVEVSKLPRFEVASVKPNTSGRVLPSLPVLTPGRTTLTNIGLRQLINMTHGIQPSQLDGLPSWAETARFDINATSPGNATVAELLLMARALLADRFHLVTRVDTRQMDIYTLEPAAPGSVKLRPSQADCGAAANTPLDQAQPAREGRPRCQIFPMTGRGRVIGTGARMSDLTNILTNVVGRQVVERTGVTGAFDVNLTWTPTPGLQPAGPGGSAPPPAQPDGPSIFTALEEQLGLRLVPGRGPVQVFVVERLDPPGPD